jgi:hypothetical protein
MVTVNLTDTFDQWRVKTNTLSTNQGDLTSLSTTDKTSIINAINEIYTSDSDDLENVIDDVTPQLGGNLDLNSSNITGTGNINITGNITGTTFLGQLSGTISATTTGVTQPTSNNSTKIATTAYVDAEVASSGITADDATALAIALGG